jgi:hypothetical protein
VCGNAKNIRYEVPRNRYGNAYQWAVTINGSTTTTSSTDSFVIVRQMPATGTVNICARYESDCGSSSPICKLVSIGNTFTGNNRTYTFCPSSPAVTYGSPSNTNPANPTPTITFDYNGGTPALDSITYTWTATTGCDSIVKLYIQRYPNASSAPQHFFARPTLPVRVGNADYSVTAGNCASQSGLTNVLTGASRYGCDSTIRFSLHNAEISSSVNASNNTLTCVAPNTTLTVTAAGGCGGVGHDFTYQWFLQGNSTVLGTATTLNTGNAGTYLVIIKDSVSGYSKYKIFYDTLSISITGAGTVPQNPSAISANAAACQGDTLTASVPAVAGATSYTWTLPAGATVIGAANQATIQFQMGNAAGNISVIGVNACGNSAIPATHAVALGSAPATPAQILGNPAPCSSLNSLPYEIPAVAGATRYNWTVPAGATLLSGQGTNSIYVDWGTSTGGNLQVTAQNGCGVSPPSILNIAVANYSTLNAGRDTAICGLSYTLGATSASGTGSWAHFPQSAASVTYNTSTISNAGINVNQADTYQFIWTETNGLCSKKDTVKITFQPVPTVALAQIADSCSPDNMRLFLRFPIANGTSPYNVYEGNTATLAGTVRNDTFISTALTPGNYNLLVKDANNCNSSSVTGLRTCNNCLTNAGQMDITPITTCRNSPVTALYLGGALRYSDANDTFEYILHTGNPRAPGAILQRAYTNPTFSFTGAMTTGTTYYIAAIAGNDSSRHVA